MLSLLSVLNKSLGYWFWVSVLSLSKITIKISSYHGFPSTLCYSVYSRLTEAQFIPRNTCYKTCKISTHQKAENVRSSNEKMLLRRKRAKIQAWLLFGVSSVCGLADFIHIIVVVTYTGIETSPCLPGQVWSDFCEALAKISTQGTGCRIFWLGDIYDLSWSTW